MSKASPGVWPPLPLTRAVPPLQVPLLSLAQCVLWVHWEEQRVQLCGDRSWGDVQVVVDATPAGRAVPGTPEGFMAWTWTTGRPSRAGAVLSEGIQGAVP